MHVAVCGPLFGFLDINWPKSPGPIGIGSALKSMSRATSLGSAGPTRLTCLLSVKSGHRISSVSALPRERTSVSPATSAQRLETGTVFDLHWRTGHGPVGAEHATIATLGLQFSAAAGALVPLYPHVWTAPSWQGECSRRRVGAAMCSAFRCGLYDRWP
jgi:hypothetical protein